MHSNNCSRKVTEAAYLTGQETMKRDDDNHGNDREIDGDKNMNKRAKEQKRNEGMDECTATIAAER